MAREASPQRTLYLAALAKRQRVIAPLLPGYGPSDECEQLRTMLDITLHTWDVADALGLDDFTLVGHSMGGMIAAEMAAIAPRSVSRLGLIAHAGLWLKEHPIPDIFAMLPYQMPQYLYDDPEAGRAQMITGAQMDNPEWLMAFLVTNARQLGMAGKLLFPIPDRGLHDRVHRIPARTVLVWGESDRLILPAYASSSRRFRAMRLHVLAKLVAALGPRFTGLEEPWRLTLYLAAKIGGYFVDRDALDAAAAPDYDNVRLGQQKKIVAVTALLGVHSFKYGNFDGAYWYKVTKAAMNAGMSILSREAAKDGVIVTLLAPGEVAVEKVKNPGPEFIAPEVSISGMIGVIEGLTLNDAGAIIRYNGKRYEF
jgi:pimeloyl-ACP methyl ester carboxylesterase